MAQFGFTAGKLAQVTTNVAFSRCFALLVGVAGTGTVTDANGTVHANVPLKEGYNPISCTKIVFGTCSDVWALYEAP